MTELEKDVSSSLAGLRSCVGTALKETWDRMGFTDAEQEERLSDFIRTLEDRTVDYMRMNVCEDKEFLAANLNKFRVLCALAEALGEDIQDTPQGTAWQRMETSTGSPSNRKRSRSEEDEEQSLQEALYAKGTSHTNVSQRIERQLQVLNGSYSERLKWVNIADKLMSTRTLPVDEQLLVRRRFAMEVFSTEKAQDECGTSTPLLKGFQHDTDRLHLHSLKVIDVTEKCEKLLNALQEDNVKLLENCLEEREEVSHLFTRLGLASESLREFNTSVDSLFKEWKNSDEFDHSYDDSILMTEVPKSVSQMLLLRSPCAIQELIRSKRDALQKQLHQDQVRQFHNTISSLGGVYARYFPLTGDPSYQVAPTYEAYLQKGDLVGASEGNECFSTKITRLEYATTKAKEELDDLSGRMSYFDQLRPLLMKRDEIILNKHAIEEGRKERLLSKKLNMAKQLLFEETVRKQVSKELPKIKESVLSICENWEQKVGRPLFVEGRNVLEEMNSETEQTVLIHQRVQEISQQENRSRSRTPLPRCATDETRNHRSRTPFANERSRSRHVSPAVRAMTPSTRINRSHQ